MDYMDKDEQNSIFLRSFAGLELAREVPLHSDSGGFVTVKRIAQEIREASALTPDGLVDVVLDGGCYRLARPGEIGTQAFIG